MSLVAGRLLGALFGSRQESASDQQSNVPQSEQTQLDQPVASSTEQLAQHAQQATGDAPEPVSTSALPQLPVPERTDIVSHPNNTLLKGRDWEGEEREVEGKALAAGQQLARDNSLALQEVKQAMQAESDRLKADVEEDLQDEASWRSIQEVEREALAAGQQLARDNSNALQEVRQTMQGSRSSLHKKDDASLTS